MYLYGIVLKSFPILAEFSRILICFEQFQSIIMTDKTPLDYLVEFLDTPSSNDNSSIRGTNNVSTENYANEDYDRPNGINGPKTPEQLSKLAIKNLSSSSLKKRQIKASNCKYCSRFQFSREQVETHLKQSETCFLLYLRHEKLNCMDGLLLKLFRCMGCGAQGSFQLKKHVEQNEKCLNYFKNRFQCQNWTDIRTYIIKVLRPSNPSRSSCKRKLENSLSSKKKDSVTVTQALNNFRKDVSLANYRLCVSCDQFFLNSGKYDFDKLFFTGVHYGYNN